MNEMDLTLEIDTENKQQIHHTDSTLKEFS